jgi:hypothetical protein
MSVKRIFSFSSGTLNRLGIGFAMGSALQQLDGAAGGLDLRARAALTACARTVTFRSMLAVARAP